MNEQFRRALEAVEAGTAEARLLSMRSLSQARERLRRALDEAQVHLEDDEVSPEPEDVFSRLDRQSRDIAEDLRRADRLMRRRTDDE